jgi:hypothetical protein
MTFRQGFRFTATTAEGLRDQLNTFVERFQTGGLVLYGIKLDDTTRTTAPAAAPATGEPNLVVVNVAGVKTLYLYDGTSWVVAGTQT